MSPEDIRALRKREGLSRSDLAFELGVTVALVGRWERGESVPMGPTLKLLDIVRRKGLDFIHSP